MTESKQQLENQLWNIANTLCGKMGADEFRDYILGFIFYKYLSRKMEMHADKILKPDNSFMELHGHPQEGCINASRLLTYIYNEHQPLRDEVFQCLDNRPRILKAREIGDRIFNKMKEFVEVFVRGVGA